jgi:hypothetical protein
MVVMSSTHIPMARDGQPIPATPFLLKSAGLSAFPGALAIDEYIHRTYVALEPFGFVSGNTLALVGVCRDELADRLSAQVRERWDLRSRYQVWPACSISAGPVSPPHTATPRYQRAAGDS